MWLPIEFVCETSLRPDDSTVPTTVRARPTPRSKSPEESLTTFLKVVVAFGIFLAVLFALGMGLLMSTLRSSNPTPAPSPDPALEPMVILPDHPRHLVNFSLSDQFDRPISSSELRGKIVVVDFMLASCSVICPYVNAQMRKIQDATAHDPDVRLLSLTLDPEDDTVAVLKNYASSYGASPERWLFLTGEPTDVRRVIGESFLPQDKEGEYSFMPGGFTNTQYIALVDRQGHIVSYYDGLNQGSSDAALAQIRKLESRHS